MTTRATQRLLQGLVPGVVQALRSERLADQHRQLERLDEADTADLLRRRVSDE
jgi:hypothetical protein